MTLGEGVYDLRATLVYLAVTLTQRPIAGRKRKYRPARENKWHPADIHFVDSSFRASFSRAVRNLVERGLLICCDNDDAEQLRFVSLRPDIEGDYADDDDPLVVR
jgi:hypothetical protein